MCMTHNCLQLLIRIFLRQRIDGAREHWVRSESTTLKSAADHIATRNAQPQFYDHSRPAMDILQDLCCHLHPSHNHNLWLTTVNCHTDYLYLRNDSLLIHITMVDNIEPTVETQWRYYESYVSSNDVDLKVEICYMCSSVTVGRREISCPLVEALINKELKVGWCFVVALIGTRR